MTDPSAVLPPASIAAGLAEARGDVLFVAADEQRAEAIAAILTAFAPATVVVQLPPVDALPGDEAPASPANVGRRVAALRRVRATLAGEKRPAVAIVTSAEATAVRLPPPVAFDAAPPGIAVGDDIDLDALAATLVEAGYIVDERVDEPGELAVRGEVIDIFPADLDAPVRIEAAEGSVVAIRRYDPVTQRSTAGCERVELGRAREPDGADGVSLLDHLPDAALGFDADAAARRDRFLAIAGERGARGRTATLVDAAA